MIFFFCVTLSLHLGSCKWNANLGQPFLHHQNFTKKRNKNFKMKCFLKVSITGWEGKNIIENSQITFDVQYVANNIGGWLKICVSYLVYSQIWLNLLMDDLHFSTASCRRSPIWVYWKNLKKDIDFGYKLCNGTFMVCMVECCNRVFSVQWSVWS